MNGDGKGTGGMGARMAIALCCLAGCNAGPGASTPPATSTAMPSTVRDAVRVATDRWGRSETSSRSPAVSECFG